MELHAVSEEKARSRGSFPIRQIPRAEGTVKPPPFYLEYAVAKLLKHAAGIVRQIDNRTHPVDEYQNESTTSPQGLTTITVQPTWDTMAERIESVIVTGPASTAFSLQIGDRYITALTGVDGKFILAPVSMILGRNDQRILTSATAGNWFLELMGWGDERY